MERLNDRDKPIDWSLRSLADKEFPVKEDRYPDQADARNYQIEIPRRDSMSQSDTLRMFESSRASEAHVNVLQANEPPLLKTKHPTEVQADPMNKPSTKDELISKETNSQISPTRALLPSSKLYAVDDDEFKLSPLTTAAEVLAKDDFKRLEHLIGLYKRPEHK